VTIYPAEIFGVDKLMGSLEPGKLANIVLADGDLLELGTKIQKVFIEGREVSLENRYTELLEKFEQRDKRNKPVRISNRSQNDGNYTRQEDAIKSPGSTDRSYRCSQLGYFFKIQQISSDQRSQCARNISYDRGRLKTIRRNKGNKKAHQGCHQRWEESRGSDTKTFDRPGHSVNQKGHYARGYNKFPEKHSPMEMR